MKKIESKGFSFFYILLIVSILLLLLPVEMQMAVYTPSIIGYIGLLLYPIILIYFILLSYTDFKDGNKKTLRKRGIVFIGYIALTIGLWYFLAYLY